MALTVEFTVEPFIEGRPGPHVRAALAAASSGGAEVDFGPFGTSLRGTDDQVLTTLDAVVRAAMGAGATRVSVQVARPNPV
jgi:uncharacterized protein YqgV (UPF0045/DUF77 family)